MLNQAQRLCAEAYGDGDYAHVTTLDECKDVGDTLFTFLMVELADKEGCEDLAEAHRRCRQAQDNIQDVIDKLEENM